MEKRAIIREVPDTFPKCVSSHPELKSLSLSKARVQHRKYREYLENQIGLEVIVLPPDNNFPDCCFVEDTAVLQNNIAVISRTGEMTRRGEVDATEKVLRDFFPTKWLEEPHTLEGGDVIHLDDQLISGVTQRTSMSTIEELTKLIDQPVKAIVDENIIHLKSYVSYLGNNNMLVTRNYIHHPVLAKFNKLAVPFPEAYAANALEINGSILLPAGYDKTYSMIKEIGYDVFTLDVSEFQKCEGALTCLSIVF